MKEAKTETGLALYDEACKLDSGIVTPETEKTILAPLGKAIACGCKEVFEMFGIYNLYGYVGNASIYKFDYLGLDNPGCDIVGAIPFFENNCRLKCCAAHDECYDMNGCKASSWFSTVNPFSRCTPCDQCNKDVVTCINDCFWNGDPDPNNEEKIYYCARQHKYISIGEGKDFATKKEATEACSSR